MPIALTDIQQLSQEVSSLVAAGLPLEKNLADAGRGHGRKLQELTTEISQRLNAGESLNDVVGKQQSGASRVLSAAISAGIRSGDLGTAIELAGDLAGDLVDLRRRIVQAIAYPLALTVMAISLFLFTGRMLLNELYNVLTDMGSNVPLVAVWVHRADQQFPQWPWAVPVAGLVVFILWLPLTKSRSVAFDGPLRGLVWIPGVGSLMRDMQFYTTTRLIHLLIERQLPMTEALILAGTCSGDAGLEAACHREAERLRKQESAESPCGVWKKGQLPPLLATCLRQRDTSEALLSERLNGLTGHYQRRIELGLAWMQHVVPGALLFIFGGGAVLVYSLSLIWPVREMYESLGTF